MKGSVLVGTLSLGLVNQDLLILVGPDSTLPQCVKAIV